LSGRFPLQHHRRAEAPQNVLFNLGRRSASDLLSGLSAASASCERMILSRVFASRSSFCANEKALLQLPKVADFSGNGCLIDLPGAFERLARN
jgi:hypothetical protein